MRYLLLVLVSNDTSRGVEHSWVVTIIDCILSVVHRSNHIILFQEYLDWKGLKAFAPMQPLREVGFRCSEIRLIFRPFASHGWSVFVPLPWQLARFPLRRPCRFEAKFYGRTDGRADKRTDMAPALDITVHMFISIFCNCINLFHMCKKQQQYM
jgi:hypothetical protein